MPLHDVRVKVDRTEEAEAFPEFTTDLERLNATAASLINDCMGWAYLATMFFTVYPRTGIITFRSIDKTAIDYFTGKLNTIPELRVLPAGGGPSDWSE
jgi:hypothetical protein